MSAATPAALTLATTSTVHTTLALASGKKRITPQSTTPPAGALTPAQIRHAYGLDQLTFNTPQGVIAADGTGQTIAIVDAYHDPTAWADLQAFDAAFGLADPPSFQQVAQDGSQNFPPTDPAGPANTTNPIHSTWELEETLDIEWAHVIAPGANILLVEANSDTLSGIPLIENAVNWVRTQPNVSVISMSFGAPESAFNSPNPSETSLDQFFTTPNGHQGITFVASTGDSGSPGVYPAYSPNVVAVGGTALTVNGLTYGSETAWNLTTSGGQRSGGGGGASTIELQPSFQQGLVTQSTTRRTTPDVAFDADPNTGVPIYDSYDLAGSPWIQIGGTSLAAPMFAALIAVADQGRTLAGLGTLDGRTTTLPDLYTVPGADFHDVTSGNNGFAAGTGYDLATGRGSPVANLLVPQLVGVDALNGHVFQDNNDDGVNDAGDGVLSAPAVALISGAGAAATGPLNVSIPDNNSAGITSSLLLNGPSGPITHLTVTLNITHTRDSDLTATLISPGGVSFTLFNGIGGSNDNFTNTTLDDAAPTNINSASAPFTGSFNPGPLTLGATFNGKNAIGTWKLNIADHRSNQTGKLISWSLAVTTGPAGTATPAPDGSYAFNNVGLGTYQLAETTPNTFIATGPTSASIATGIHPSNINFGFFPTVFTASNPNDIFYVWLDTLTNTLDIGTTDSPTNAVYKIAVASAPSFTFNLNASGSRLVVDYSMGNPLPTLPGSIFTMDGGGLADSELDIIGPPSAQAFTMTDTQIGPTGANAVQFQNLGTLSIANANVFFTGSLNTLQNLIIDSGTNFNWD